MFFKLSNKNFTIVFYDNKFLISSLKVLKFNLRYLLIKYIEDCIFKKIRTPMLLSLAISDFELPKRTFQTLAIYNEYHPGRWAYSIN